MRRSARPARTGTAVVLRCRYASPRTALRGSPSAHGSPNTRVICRGSAAAGSTQQPVRRTRTPPHRVLDVSKSQLAASGQFLVPLTQRQRFVTGEHRSGSMTGPHSHSWRAAVISGWSRSMCGPRLRGCGWDQPAGKSGLPRLHCGVVSATGLRSDMGVRQTGGRPCRPLR
jgi:hypothetical protein